MHYIPPISRGEFLQHLQRCVPPGGWNGRIVVANSGGPDSICLLYLLSSLLKGERTSGLPSDVVSVHVDHNIQETSTHMAEHAAESARLLGVSHLTLRVPWSRPPFPANPANSTAFEGICRDARRNRLSHSMEVSNASTIAFAHHADDQVETSIMRMTSGSGKLGASGMRSLSRWGMGERDDNLFTWTGEKGMNRYIVRPLLEVSKDRILATCEVNALQYVTDPTNSQPDITLRNYVRDFLSRGVRHAKTDLTKSTLDPPYADKVPETCSAIQSLRSLVPEVTGPSQLREAVRLLGYQVSRVDAQVTNLLRQHLHSSPPTTLLLPSTALKTIEDPDIQTALVRRVLRYVSPQPWGHVSAEADGSRRTLQKIANRLCSLRCISPPTSFTMGAKVWWRPVYLRGNKIGFGVAERDRCNNRLAWLAQRERPWATTRLDRVGFCNTLTKDVTLRLRDAFVTNSSCTVLYDCRALVRFDMTACPPVVGEALRADKDASILIIPATAYLLPQIVKRKLGNPDTVLATFPWPEAQLQRKWVKSPSTFHAPWITISSIRTWDRC